jgi:hypothetical protein
MDALDTDVLIYAVAPGRRRHGVVPSVGDVLRSADPQRPMP